MIGDYKTDNSAKKQNKKKPSPGSGLELMLHLCWLL